MDLDTAGEERFEWSPAGPGRIEFPPPLARSISSPDDSQVPAGRRPTDGEGTGKWTLVTDWRDPTQALPVTSCVVVPKLLPLSLTISHL